MRYANKTTVTVDRSRTEIERTLARYGATSFVYGWEENKAMIAFKANGRTIRFILPMPDREEFTHGGSGRKRAQLQIKKAVEQAQKQRFRALALAIKAKLEMVETGITSFEEEFLAHIVLPSGETVGQWIAPQLGKLDGRMPPLLNA